MIYDKLMRICIALSVIVFISSSVLFATTDIMAKEDIVVGSIMKVLLRIQSYSWPVMVVILVYALYQYYVIGSEAFEYKVNGQKMIMGISVFMTIIQCLPLVYAFVTIGL